MWSRLSDSLLSNRIWWYWCYVTSKARWQKGQLPPVSISGYLLYLLWGVRHYAMRILKQPEEAMCRGNKAFWQQPALTASMWMNHTEVNSLDEYSPAQHLFVVFDWKGGFLIQYFFFLKTNRQTALLWYNLYTIKFTHFIQLEGF